MSDRRRKGGGEGRGRKILVWCGWGLLVVLLGGNLVLALARPEGDTPQSVITPEHVQSVAFWGPMGAALLASILGLWWASKAYAHSERTSLLWARRGYVFTLVGSAVFLMATYDPEMFPRHWLSVVAAVVLGGQAVFSAMFALKEYRRAETGDGSRRPRGHLETPTMPVIPGPAPESPGPAK